MAQNTQTIDGDKKRKDKSTILGPHVFRMSNYGQRDNALDMQGGPCDPPSVGGVGYQR